MKKSITHFICGGARHSCKLSAVLSFLLVALMLIPGSARAEGESSSGSDETSSTIFKYTEVEGGISISGFKDDCSAENLEIPAEIDGKPVVAIGKEAFHNKQTIKSVSIPSTVTTLEDLAFNNCVALTSVTFAANSQLASIGEWGFRSTGITSIEIPTSVTTIGEEAFYGCNALTSLTFATGSQLASIGKRAFYKTAITSIEIPSSVKTMGAGAFAACGVLTSVTFAANSQLASIENTTFYSSGITSIAIPSSVTTIGDYAFCFSALASITFAANSQLTSIGEYVFQSAPITSIEIPSSVTTIGGYAFLNCGALTSVTFAANSQLTSIGENAFCTTAISSIEIPSSVTTIGDYAFADCYSLTSVTFCRIPIGENPIEGYGTLYDENLNLNTICVPKGSEEIYKAQLNPGDDVTLQGVYIEDDDHFYRFEINEAKDGLACAGFAEKGKDIKDNVIPSMASGCPVTAVAEKAFLNHDLEYVNIPESIKTIGALAFAGNESLTDVELDGADTQIAADAFQGDAAIECFYTVNEAAYDKYLAQTFEGKEKLVVHPTEELVLTDETGFTAASRPTYYDGDLMTYERQLDAPGEYATLCLPFSLWLDQTNGIFDKVYVPMNILIHNTAKSTPEQEHFVLMLEEQASDAIIPAGQPVFVKLSETENKIALSNYDDELLTAALQPKGQTMKVVDWDGTSGLMTQNTQFSISYGSLYQPKDQVVEADHIWSFNANGSFGPQSEGAMPPFRLFLTVEENAPSVQAKAYSISIGVSDGSTTDIHEIISSDDAISTNKPNASSAHAGIIYGLNGRKVATASEAQHLGKGIYIQNGKKMVVK